jgi:hypothetical protein
LVSGFYYYREKIHLYTDGATLYGKIDYGGDPWNNANVNVGGVKAGFNSACINVESGNVVAVCNGNVSATATNETWSGPWPLSYGAADYNSPITWHFGHTFYWDYSGGAGDLVLLSVGIHTPKWSVARSIYRTTKNPYEFLIPA